MGKGSWPTLDFSLFIILYALKILWIHLVDFITCIDRFFDFCNFIDCNFYLFCCYIL